MCFKYNFKSLSKREIGYMMQTAKESWPTDAAPNRYYLEYYDQLYDELLRRWACEDDAIHRQGQRL